MFLLLIIMAEIVDTVQMRIRREPTWAELTDLKTKRQLIVRKEVSYDEIIQGLLREHRQKQEASQ